MIEKFDIFLFNMIMESKANGEMRLLFSNRLKSLLKTINDSISKKLLEAERDIDVETKRMFIDFDENDPKRLSFIMINKLKDIFHESDYEYVIDKYPNFYDSRYFDIVNNSKLKGTIGINQFINEIFKNEYISTSLSEEQKKSNKELGIKTKPQELEEFIDKFKSYRTPGEFELVSGSDIVFWYNEQNYSKGGGDLNSSCMRYNNCASYIDFYAQNEDMVSLLIMKDREDDTKIIGRTLVWNLTTPDGRIFMDRIYTTIKSDVELFKQYAKKYGWLYKYQQNMDAEEFIFDTKTNTKQKMILEVDNITTDDWEFPYMDTMKYFEEIAGNGSLSNSLLILNHGCNLYKLDSTEGGYTGVMTIEQLRDERKEQIIDNIYYYALDYTYNKDLWNFIDNEKFIEDYREITSQLMTVTFKDDFNSHYELKRIINEIDYNYFDIIKDMDIQELYKFIEDNNLKEKIIQLYLDDVCKSNTPEMIFTKFMHKKLSQLKEKEFESIIEKYLDVDGFAKNISDSISINELLDR